MAKIITCEAASALITDNMSVMIGGFLGVGTPENLVDRLVFDRVKNLIIIGNDTSFPDRGIGKLIANRQVKKAIVSHIGTNPEKAHWQ